MNMRGDTTISIPKWAWTIICGLSTVAMGGAWHWGSGIAAQMNQLERNSVDRATVNEMLEKQGPYMRDKAQIEARLLATEKLLDRHDSDVRRLSDTMGRVEAKLDLMMPKPLVKP